MNQHKSLSVAGLLSSCIVVNERRVQKIKILGTLGMEIDSIEWHTLNTTGNNKKLTK